MTIDHKAGRIPSREAQLDLISTYHLISTMDRSLCKELLQRFLSNHLPWGNIIDAWLEDDGCVAFKVEKRSIRHCDLEAFLVLLLLTMWGGPLYFDNVTSKVRQDSGERILLYPRLGDGTSGPRVYFQRVIANARAGQVVRLHNHRDLCMAAVELTTGQAWENSRKEAMRLAVTLYHEAVTRGGSSAEGHAPLIFDYEAVVRGACQLLDDAHGHELKGIKNSERDSEAAE